MRGQKREDRSCSVPDCGAVFYAQELCKRHYYRKKRHGDPLKFAQAKSYDKYDENGNRWCSRHKDWLPVDRFEGKKTWCRECRRLGRYNLTSQQYAELVDKHQGKCPLCLTRKADVIDHDHDCCPGRQSCGKCVRGVICKQCNAALGTLTEQGVKRAELYLRKKAK